MWNKIKIYLAADSVLVFVIWQGLMIWVVRQHAPWRDEMMNWLIATKAASLGDFFEAIRYERNPPGQYIIQACFYWIGMHLPGLSEIWSKHYSSLPYVLSGISSSFLAGLFIFRMTYMPKWFRYLIPFGLVFLMEYGMLSRNYGFAAAFLIFGAHFYREGRFKPFRIMLVLAGSMHLFFTLISGMIFLVDAWNRRREFKALALESAIIAVFFLIFCGFAIPPADTSFPSQLGEMGWGFWRLPILIAHGLTGLDDFRGEFHWNQTLWHGKKIFLAFIPLIWMIWKRNFPFKKYILILLAPTLLLAGLGEYHPFRYAAIYYVVALYLLISDKSKLKISPAFSFYVVLMVLGSLRWLIGWNPFQALPNYDFSGSLELKREIGEIFKDPQNLFVANSTYLLYGVMGVMDIKGGVFVPGRNRFMKHPLHKAEINNGHGNYCKWNTEEYDRRFGGRIVYLILGLNASPPQDCPGRFDLVFKNKRDIRGQLDEKFAVYRYQRN